MPYSIPPSTFAEWFPFYIAMDAELRVLRHGDSLSRALPTLRDGELIADHLVLSSPPDTPWTAAALREIGVRRLCVLDHPASGLRLRGAFHPLDDGRILFLGSPWMLHASELRRFGLRLEDFAIYDPIGDLLQALHAQQSAQADLRRLVDRLTAQRTELRATNERLEAMVQAAQSATVAKSNFLANMSHEIRTPMNGILGLAELLRECALPEEAAEYARLLHESAGALLAILNGVLDYSKLEAGQLALDAVPMAPDVLVRDVAALLGPVAARKGLPLRVVTAVPPPTVLGDPGRLRQVLLNLVGNAIKFTRRGEVVVGCGGTRQPDGTVQLVVTVEDTGIGIAPSALPTLFTQFSQADAGIARQFGGTGLGLAISKAIVEQMGGTIGVRSEPGVGTTVELTLPLPAATAAEALPELPPVAPADLAHYAGEMVH